MNHNLRSEERSERNSHQKMNIILRNIPLSDAGEGLVLLRPQEFLFSLAAGEPDLLGRKSGLMAGMSLLIRMFF